MAKCWEHFKCGKTKCPAYEKEDVKCWLVSGTHCRNEIQGKFLTKIVKCIDCEVFKANLDDESARKTLEVLKRQLEERDKVQRYLDVAAVIMLVIDANEQVSLINKKGCETLGYIEGEIIGKNWFDNFVPVHQRDKLRQAFKSLMAGDLSNYEYIENSVLAKNGEEELIVWHNTVLKDDEGAIVATLSSGENVTERRVMERRLAKINECFLSFKGDPSDNFNRLVALCGELLGATCALYNHLDRGLLVSAGQWHTPDDFNPVDSPEGHICYDVIKKGQDEVIVVRDLLHTAYADSDPNVRKYQLQAYVGHPVRCRGKYVGSLCTVYQKDIVPNEGDKKIMGILAAAIGVEEDRLSALEELQAAYEKIKSTEAQLVQSSKMASLGVLAGGVAHEINNPLVGILNNVQLIKMQSEAAKEFNLDEFKQFLNVIEESAKRCVEITQSLLDFSHTSKDIFEPVNLNLVIERSIALVERDMQLENIAIQKQLASELPQVSADAQLLQQVLLDIIANAKWAIQKKSGKEGGLVSITTRYNPQSKQAIVSVSDTGIGIPKVNLNRIFEPFFTTKQVGEGTGLGLSVVYNIIKAHKGFITVESDEGKGAVFTISFPVEK